MSGGYFDYKQYTITDIEDELQHVLKRLEVDPDTSENEYDENRSLKPYIDDIPKFKEKINTAINYLKKTSVYINRIDYFLSQDDGEETFYKRLKEELKQIDPEENKNIIIKTLDELKEIFDKPGTDLSIPEYIKKYIHFKSIEDSIVILKLKIDIIEDIKKDLYYDDWTEISKNIFTKNSKNTKNTLIIEAKI
jgi:hypothetical protein